MDRGRDTKHDLSRIRFFRRFADLLTRGQIIIDAFPKSGLQSADRIRVKSNHIANTRDAAGEQFIVSIKLHGGAVTPIFQYFAHGFTPNLIKNSRASRT